MADGTGLAVAGADGMVTAVDWPTGWTVREGEHGLELIGSGRVIAEGSHVRMGGGMNLADSAFVPCGPIEVKPRR